MKKLAYAFVAPAVLILTIFFVCPIFYIIYLSFFDWNFVTPDMDFVFLDNFINLINDANFRQVLVNTSIYTGLTMFFTLSIALLTALWLGKDGKIYSFAQSAIFSPHIISLVSISMLWMWIMDADYGLLNVILKSFGLEPLGWLTDSSLALYSLVIVSVWKSIGYYTLIFIAGLRSIPKDLYEAAELDNSSGFRTFSKITLPMLSPTIFFVVITSFISCFKVFETIAIMTNGGPANSTNTIVYYIYEYGFRFFKIGYASAAGVILLLIISICTLLYFKFMSRRVYYR